MLFKLKKATTTSIATYTFLTAKLVINYIAQKLETGETAIEQI